MWQADQTMESNGRVAKLKFIPEAGSAHLTLRGFLQNLADSAQFRTRFSATLAGVPFEAFRWETPAASTATIDDPFECVVLDNPSLTRAPDAKTFAPQIARHAVNDVATFMNLGRDATMVVPAPVPSVPLSSYVHLAAFLRNAPPKQVHALWQAVGNSMLERLSPHPVWLSTAGAGVAWLHIRIDTRPKYYGYASYTRTQ